MFNVFPRAVYYLLFFVFVLLNSAHATTYYVDGVGGDGLVDGGDDTNTGTSISTPFLTLNKANSMVRAGYTVEIRGGTYNDLIDPAQNGEPGSKIIYTNNANEMVVINGKTGIQNGVSVNLQGRRNIVLDGLDLSSDELTGARTSGVNARGSQNIEFRNLRIVNPYDISQDFPISAAVVPRGMTLSNAKKILVENVTISGWYIGLAFGGNSQFITIRNSIITNNLHHEMVAASGNGTIQGHLIEGNIIGGSLASDGFQTDFYEVGSTEIKNRGMIFRNNYFFFNAENAIDLKSGGDFIIENNVFAGMQANNDGTGARNAGSADTTTRGGAAGAVQRGSGKRSGQVIIRKNVFYDNIGGIAAKESDWMLYNNTVVANNRDYTGWSSTYPDGDLTQRVAFVGMVVRYMGNAVYVNNIVTNNNQGAAWYVEGGGSNRLLDYNLYNDASGSLRFLSRPENSKRFERQDIYPSLAAWKTYLMTQTDVVGKEANSLEADPLFVNVPDNPFFNFKQVDVFNPTFAPDVNFSNLATWFPYDFRLQSGSEAIDNGGFLTAATNSGMDSDVLIVDDSRYFFDGYGIAGEGDTIQIGNRPPVKIQSINYTTNTIILAESRTWTDGDDVSLPYEGTRPDIGAFEFTEAGGNTAPTGVNDNATTNQNVAVTVDVLANDTDPDAGDTLSISIITQGNNGSVTNNGTDVSYMPDIGFVGSDNFTYTVSDGSGGFDTATVNLTVTSTTTNQAPIAVNDTGTTAQNIPIVINLLGNDLDSDGDVLSITALDKTSIDEGTITDNGDGTVRYTPANNFSGNDRFNYTVSDGNGGFDTATVIVTVTSTVTPGEPDNNGDSSEGDENGDDGSGGGGSFDLCALLILLLGGVLRGIVQWCTCSIFYLKSLTVRCIGISAGVRYRQVFPGHRLARLHRK